MAGQQHGSSSQRKEVTHMMDIKNLKLKSSNVESCLSCSETWSVVSDCLRKSPCGVCDALSKSDPGSSGRCVVCSHRLYLTPTPVLHQGGLNPVLEGWSGAGLPPWNMATPGESPVGQKMVVCSPRGLDLCAPARDDTLKPHTTKDTFSSYLQVTMSSRANSTNSIWTLPVKKYIYVRWCLRHWLHL